ncbi:MAG: hypothetical protein ACE5K7_00225 [Phycisphaerae bacterium]
MSPKTRQPRPGPSFESIGEAAETRIARMHKSYLQKAIRLFRDGDYAEAGSAFKIAAAMESRPGIAQLGLVHAAFAMGRYGLAAAALVPLLREQADLANAGLAELLYGQQPQLSEQVGRFRQAMRRFDQNPRAMALAAYIFWAAGEQDLARSSAAKAAKLDPDEPAYKALLEQLQTAESTGPASR